MQNDSTDIAALRTLIKSELETIDLCAEPKELYEPIAYAMENSGKMLRPLLLLLSCRHLGGNISAAAKPAAAVELFHNFTLVHDDIMDNAPVRRNKPSVYRKWNADIALLAGDVMLAMAYRKLAQSPSALLPALLRIFNETAIRVCEGQQMDLNLENRPGSKDEYMRMIGLKTAALIAGSMAMGAVAAGAHNAQAEMMYEGGLQIGLAFQIQDDSLDAFGTTQQTGKAIGGDILAQKTTLPHLLALQLADKKQEQRLSSLLSDTDMDEYKKVQAVLDIYRELRVENLLAEEFQKHYDKGLEILTNTKPQQNEQSALITYTRTLLKRDH